MGDKTVMTLYANTTHVFLILISFSLSEGLCDYRNASWGMESHLGFYSSFPDIGNYFPISGIRIPDIGKWKAIWVFIHHFPITEIISRYRKISSLISENHFPILGNWLFPDIGNLFPGIGNSNSRYREMLNKNPNGFPYRLGTHQRCFFFFRKIT